jgi:hypothetical protein
VKPFLHSEDIHLRDAAIEILPKVPEGDVISLLNEPVSTVTAFAIDACKEMWIETVHYVVINFLTETNPIVRIAAIKYLTEYPTEKGRIEIENLRNREEDIEVKKELDNALQVFQRKGNIL